MIRLALVCFSIGLLAGVVTDIYRLSQEPRYVLPPAAAARPEDERLPYV